MSTASVPSPCRILIVDDMPDLQAMLKILLSGEGYEVDLADSAPHALDVIADHHIDVLLTDFSMPEMSGGDLIRILRRRPALAGLPIILMSGALGDELPAGLDATALLRKPFELHALLSILDDLDCHPGSPPAAPDPLH